MAYMGNRWGAPPPKPKVTVKPVEYAEKKELNDFEDRVRHDFVKIVEFLNEEVQPEVNKMHADLDETMHRTDVLARHVYDLQHEVRELREKEMCAPAVKRRLRVAVRAGKDKVQIIRND